jgi:EAL domain-containing protein (putative c-di-GMP-specific phosphodiesterase class I)
MKGNMQENRALCHKKKTKKEFTVKFKKIIYYQPVVNVSASEVLFYESLLRFVGEDGGIFPPTPFVQQAEADGSIVVLDAESLSTVFTVLAVNPHLTLSLNVSCLSLENSLWAQSFYEGAKAHPDVLSRLVVEVTETQNFLLSPEACDRLRQIRSLGVRLALDDVDQVLFPCLQGRLKSFDFQVDFLKISRHLTMDFEHNRGRTDQVSALLGLAHDYGITPIIEGVETKAQCESLSAQGIVVQQGYYWGRPASVFAATVPV